MSIMLQAGLIALVLLVFGGLELYWWHTDAVLLEKVERARAEMQSGACEHAVRWHTNSARFPEPELGTGKTRSNRGVTETHHVAR